MLKAAFVCVRIYFNSSVASNWVHFIILILPCTLCKKNCSNFCQVLVYAIWFLPAMFVTYMKSRKFIEHSCLLDDFIGLFYQTLYNHNTKLKCSNHIPFYGNIRDIHTKRCAKKSIRIMDVVESFQNQLFHIKNEAT